MGKYAHWLEPWTPPPPVKAFVADPLDLFDPEQREWLRRRVDLEAPDLRLITREELWERERMLRKEHDAIGINDSLFILTFVFQWYLRWRQGAEPPLRGNLRSFWYRHLSRQLERLGLLEPPRGVSVSALGGDRGRYLLKTMENAFEELHLSRFFRYRDIEVYDQRERFRRVGDQRRHILYTEKEGLFWFLLEMHDLYDITVFASRGSASWIDVDYLVADLERYRVRNLVVATLTDYDPWGATIGRTFGDKLRRHPTWKFRNIDDVSLTAVDLFDPERIPHIRRYLLKDHEDPNDPVHRFVMDWVAAGGGINGEPYGLHVDNVEWPLARARVDQWVKGRWP